MKSGITNHMTAQPDVVTDVTTDVQIKPPHMWHVVFYNDNKTYYEFVILVLMQLFGKSYEEAARLTDQIHQDGKQVVATYTYEIALSKRDETITLARANGHPLRVELEPEDAST
jgi:ATP-dependent Clp protease adaptor protein ClpS